MIAFNTTDGTGGCIWPGVIKVWTAGGTATTTTFFPTIAAVTTTDYEACENYDFSAGAPYLPEKRQQADESPRSSYPPQTSEYPRPPPYLQEVEKLANRNLKARPPPLPAVFLFPHRPLTLSISIPSMLSHSDRTAKWNENDLRMRIRG